MARISQIGVHRFNGSSPPVPPNTSGEWATEVVVINLNEFSQTVTVVLYFDGAEIDRRTVTVPAMDGVDPTLSGQVTTGPAGSSHDVCAEIV